jgi:hypothetical protein
VPASFQRPLPFSCSPILAARLLEFFSDHLFAFLPECLGVFRVERITAHTFADRGDSHIIWNYFAHVAVLAILSADLISRSNYSGPYRSCGSLRNGLQLEGCFALGRTLLIHLLDHLLDVGGVHMAVQFRLDASWMYRRRAYAIPSMTPVKSNGEEDIRCLGPAVGNEGFIRRPPKVRIVEIHIRKAVTGRRKIDHPSTFAEKSSNAVHQNKVAQVIGAELRLEPHRQCGQRVWP